MHLFRPSLQAKIWALSFVALANLGWGAELKPEELQFAFEVLSSSDYLEKDKIKEVSSVSTLLKQGTASLSLVPENTGGVSPTKTRKGEFLLEGVYYVLISDVSEHGIYALEAELKEALDHKADTLLLDLRSSPKTEETEDLVRFLEIFMERGTALFRRSRDHEVQDLYSSSRDPIWKGAIYILLDSESSATACFIAANLVKHLHAKVVGKFTQQPTYHFEKVILSESLSLRYADSSLTFDMDQDPLEVLSKRQIPLKEDLETKKLWRLDQGADLKSKIFESSPRRFDELALMNGEDPEIFHFTEKDESLPEVCPAKDLALVQAVDLILATRFLKPGKLILQDAPSGGNIPSF